MAKTESEILFEKFCADNGIAIKPIPVGPTRTPDYEITLGAGTAIAEITQFDSNEADKTHAKDLAEKGIATIGGTIGKRVRDKIEDKNHQIKERTKELVPGILVLVNNTGVTSYTGSEHIRAAMYGFDTFVLSDPAAPGPATVKDKGFGTGRMFTPEANTAISAISVLEPDVRGALLWRVYHNVFAKAPIILRDLNKPAIEQYTLAPKKPGQFQTWAKIEMA